MIEKVTPIQMPNMDMEELIEGRRQFTKEEWIDILIKSIGMEPTQLKNEVKWHTLGNNLNQRDVIEVRKTVSGLVKLIYPHSEFIKEDTEEILRYALIGRREKEQFKKIGGMEFYDVHFST